MLWTEATPMCFAGSQPCVAVCWKTIVVSYLTGGDAYYTIGELDTGQRTIHWTTGGEWKFLTGGVKGLTLAISSNLEVGVVYSKSSVSSMVNPLYFIMGKLTKEKNHFFLGSGIYAEFRQDRVVPFARHEVKWERFCHLLSAQVRSFQENQVLHWQTGEDGQRIWVQGQVGD